MATQITEQNFEAEVLKSDKPVLVDFWATWCGPCQMMGPIVEELAEELKDTVKVCKIDVDQNSAIAEKYGIMSIPNFILFKNGEVASQQVGATSKENLAEFARS